MAWILNIDTSSGLCSVCVARDGEIAAISENSSGRDHASVITLLIQQVLTEAGIDTSALDAIAVSQGPGSYTGLRIGMATAKGMCFALGLPLIAIPTTKALAYAMHEHCGHSSSYWYIAVVPSRKDEWYAAVYDALLEEMVPPQIVETHFDFCKWLPDGQKSLLAGLPLNNLNSYNSNCHISLVTPVNHSSANLAHLSYKSHQIIDYKSLIYCEPLYLQGVYIGTGINIRKRQ